MDATLRGHTRSGCTPLVTASRDEGRGNRRDRQRCIATRACQALVTGTGDNLVKAVYNLLILFNHFPCVD